MNNYPKIYYLIRKDIKGMTPGHLASLVAQGSRLICQTLDVFHLNALNDPSDIIVSTKNASSLLKFKEFLCSQGIDTYTIVEDSIVYGIAFIIDNKEPNPLLSKKLKRLSCYDQGILNAVVYADSKRLDLIQSIKATISFIKEHKCQRCQNWYSPCKKDDCLFYPILSRLSIAVDSTNNNQKY